MSTAPRIEFEQRPDSPLRCALCHDGLEPDTAWTCPGCATVTHVACADDARGCPTLGCRPRRQPRAVIDPTWPFDLRPFAAVGLLILPMSAVVGLVAGCLFTGSSIEEGLFDGSCIVITCTVGGGVAGGLCGLVQREATRVGARAAGRLVVGFLLACACVGGALLGFSLTSRDRSLDNTDGPFR